MNGPLAGARRPMVDAFAAFAAMASVLLFSSGALQYAFDTQLTTVAPTFFILAFVAIAACLFLSQPGPPDIMGRVIVGWCAGYLMLSIAGIFLSADVDNALGVFRQRVLAVMFVLAMRTICGSAAGYRFSQRATVVVLVTSVALNVYEWYSPLSFSPVYGRAAGLYENPNISGGAIAMTMIVALVAVPRVWRELLVLVAGIGVVLTVSRGALLALAASLLLMFVRGNISRRRLGLAVVAASLLVAAGGVPAWTDNDVILKQTDLLDRLTYGGSLADPNTGSRLSLAESGLRQFADSPWVGAGLGATDWQHALGTHNIYVMHLAEHGMLGLGIVPLLLGILLYRAWTVREDRVALPLAVFLAVWGLFSHNVLDEFHTLLIIAIALAPYGVVARAADSRALTAEGTVTSRLPVNRAFGVVGAQ